MTDGRDEKRQLFEGYAARPGGGVIEPARDRFWYACPCCGHPTLPERGGYDICRLCDWEDDGQDDPHADEVRGGPNGRYSLAEARENFRRYWVMYRPDNDTRIIPGDSALTLAAKEAMVEAFGSLAGADEAEQVRLWAVVEDARATLEAEVQREVREYERRVRERRAR